MKPQKLDILICRMAYTGYENCKLVSWLLRSAIYLHTHPGIGQVYHTAAVKVSPVARARNFAAHTAIKSQCDILVMVDHDIIPSDGWLGQAIQLIQENRAEGRHAIVAAPAICDDGKTNINVYHTPILPGGFTWGGPPQLRRHGVQEASLFSGVGDAAAVGTGCIAIDTAIFHELPQPWFALEHADVAELQIATGEDFYFTRNAAQEGFNVLVTWDEWATHRKEIDLAKPEPIDPFTIPARYREAVGMLMPSELPPPEEGEKA